MNYPLISEYIEAIRYAEDNFDKLVNLRPVLDNNGNPVMSSGNFAAVFKMRNIETGKYHAVKCFIKEQEGREERYRKISEELEYVSSPYLVHARYMERELFVSADNCGEEEFPVLVMEWVEGQPLDAYLRQCLNDRYALSMLAYRFCKMGAWLLSQPFAHGDIKPDNIIIRNDGTPVLVDYDGMYVPAMEGENASETGSPDFRHPLRTNHDFGSHMDDFSIASIALSLKAIALNPALYDRFAAADRLLFSAADYRDIGNSPAFQAIMPLTSDTELSSLFAAFLLSLAKKDLGMVSFRLFFLAEPEKPEVEVMSTEITDEEREHAVTDEHGVMYTKDWKKLIKAPNTLESYIIREGTKVIGDSAFYRCWYLENINIPKSVTSIGEDAFSGCYELTSLNFPEGVTSIGNFAFSGCRGLTSINIPESVKSIGERAFYRCYDLTSIVVASGNSVYDSRNDCNAIIRTSDNCLIRGCNDTVIPFNVTSIGDFAFSGCKKLISINIPKGVTSIGESAFSDCIGLTSINIPEYLTSIGSSVLSGCIGLTSIVVASGNSVYDSRNDCNAIIRTSDNCLIQGCKNTIIPNNVTSIGESAFYYCRGLTSINIPQSVTNIGKIAFYKCYDLTSINIPESVTSIGESAFYECI